ncbi:MAG: helix-turn-helix transcriptional regulator [Solobacterium sp.]|nr:helix-turn-helix transcriptional regulator [Solobacterium sp.]
MKHTLSSLISIRGPSYLNSARIKHQFIQDLRNLDPRAYESFESFFKEFSSTAIMNQDSKEALKTMGLYIICQIMGVMISSGIEEDEINQELLSDFYLLDQAEDVSSTLEHLRKVALHMIDYSLSRRRNRSHSSVIEQVVQYVTVHLEEKITLQETAEAMNYSASYLSHKFRSEMELSFSAYVRMRKIERSKTLLMEGYSIEEVAERLCFSSASHFISSFREELNMTPRQFCRWIG